MVWAHTDLKSDERYNATYIKQDIIPHVSHLFPSINSNVMFHSNQAEQYHLKPIRATLALASQRQTPLFSWMDAKYALSINRLSYCRLDQIKTFACDDCDDMKLKFVYKAESPDSAQVVVTSTETFLLVGFHGSSKEIPAWLSELHTQQTKFPCLRCKVNEAFYHQFLEMVDKTMDAVTELHEQDPTLPIYLTGHSSGAALATLLAVHISIHSPSLPLSRIYTFGSPRVGNAAFASFANKLMGERWFRIINQLDIVPSVPAYSFGYQHVGQLMVCTTGTTICTIKGRNEENEGGSNEDLVRLSESSSDIRACHFTYWTEHVQCTIKN